MILFFFGVGFIVFFGIFTGLFGLIREDVTWFYLFFCLFSSSDWKLLEGVILFCGLGFFRVFVEVLGSECMT